MKKELNGGVVVGILVAVGLVVAVLAWRFVIAPPAPAGIKPFDKATLKVWQQKHADSVKSTQEEQMRLYRQSHGGG
jgi:hypothetical protein